jgi:hypothetical protein
VQGYQCAYPGGACTWADNTGKLQNTHQTNCPGVAPCPASGCACPVDNNLDTGLLINEFKGYQCAYPGGACTWDNVSHPCARQGGVYADAWVAERRAVEHPPDELPDGGQVRALSLIQLPLFFFLSQLGFADVYYVAAPVCLVCT